jgi:hypothetical protein
MFGSPRYRSAMHSAFELAREAGLVDGRLPAPAEERAKNGPERDASRLPRPAAPALTWNNVGGASWNRTSDLILIRDAL